LRPAKEGEGEREKERGRRREEEGERKKERGRRREEEGERKKERGGSPVPSLAPPEAHRHTHVYFLARAHAHPQL